MSTARILAEFVTSLKYDQIPLPVIERAKACIIDTVAASIYGSSLPWSKIIIDYVSRTSAPGNACVIGTPSLIQASMAALVNGALAHSFELDSPVHPSVGVHPGPGCVSPGLAAGQQLGKSGKDLIVAFVAGFEIMYRLGESAPQSSEQLGFHAPGLFGTFGGALTAGCLYELNVNQMINAIGIAGSLCSGLLEFSQSGGMIKRLHPGRAAESGILAADLASNGFTAPDSIIEGKYGFLNVYTRNANLSLVTADLGLKWKTMNIAHKLYACHGTSHVPVTAALMIKAQHNFNSNDIDYIELTVGSKVVTHHNIPEPKEITTAQYSAPFCVALALCRNPLDPNSFCEESIVDPEVRRLCSSVRIELLTGNLNGNAKATKLTLNMKDGRKLSQYLESYKGMPDDPLNKNDLRSKYDLLTKSMSSENANNLFIKMLELEKVDNLCGLQMH